MSKFVSLEQAYKQVRMRILQENIGRDFDAGDTGYNPETPDDSEYSPETIELPTPDEDLGPMGLDIAGLIEYYEGKLPTLSDEDKGYTLRTIDALKKLLRETDENM